MNTTATATTTVAHIGKTASPSPPSSPSCVLGTWRAPRRPDGGTPPPPPPAPRAAAAGQKTRAGLSPRFRDKQPLYEAVLARGLEPIVALVAGGAPRGGAAAPEAVDGVLDGLLDYLEARPHVPQLIQRAGL